MTLNRNNWQHKPGDRIFRPRRIRRFRLRRVLGVSAVFSAGYGNVGSSIYYALGIVALAAMGATPVALGIAGILFICTALTYAEGTAMLPEAGGSATFTRHGFNDMAGFIAGWALMLSYKESSSLIQQQSSISCENHTLKLVAKCIVTRKRKLDFFNDL